MLINIDAGHGSQTSGKRTPDGYKEHTANVKVASYFGRALTRCGLPYTKTGWNDDNSEDDADTSITNRQKAVKSAKCDISISFHFNAYGDGKTYNSASGIETLIHSTKAYQGDSLKLANKVHANLIMGTSQKNRGVKTQALGMCNCNALGTKAAILIECAFMTNATEASMMKSDAFCKECAEETCKGLCEYLGIIYVPETQNNFVPQTPNKNTLDFRVKIKVSSLNIRSGPGTNYKVVSAITKGGVYTIIETKGSWGRLKSGAGWISISNTYVERL